MSGTVSNTLIQTHVLGFPHLGAQRELAVALEARRRGLLSADALHAVGRALRTRHWAAQRAAGLDWVTVGDFAYVDQVANHLHLFGCGAAGHMPDAAHAPHLPSARGWELANWFDTRARHVVPELTATTAFTLHAGQLLAEVAEAQALGHPVKVALLGPLTLLWLGKESAQRNAAPFCRLDLLEALLPVYGALLAQLTQLGVAWVQMDEPILGLDLPAPWRNAFERSYWQLNQAGAKMMLATYFSPLEENLSLACRLPVAGLHVDGVRAPHELTSVCDWLPTHKVLSVGIVDGRNVWRCDLDAALAVLRPLLDRRGNALWLAPSCSLLHVPLSLEGEQALTPALRSRLAFACEKLAELQRLKQLLGARLEPLPVAAAPQRERGDEVPGALDYVAAQLAGCALTRHGWVQTWGAECSKPPLIHGDVAHQPGQAPQRPLEVRNPLQLGPVTLLQASFARTDQAPHRIAAQIALVLPNVANELARAGIAVNYRDDAALRDGLPLRSSRREAYLAWATAVSLLGDGAAAMVAASPIGCSAATSALPSRHISLQQSHPLRAPMRRLSQ